MTPEKQAEMKEAIRQVDAIFALEGFYPTEQIRIIDAALVAGRVTATQAVEELAAYVREHKTMKGFLESRPWVV